MQAALTFAALLKIYIIAESQARGGASASGPPPSALVDPGRVRNVCAMNGSAGESGENFNEKRPALCTINDFS